MEGEQHAVRAMLAALHEGPPAGRVHSVETVWETPVGAAGFVIGSASC